MSNVEILILALALSLDAMIVSFSFGLIINSKKAKNSLMLAASFGFFQFFMPIIGWFLSSFVYSFLEGFSKWIVFAVFLALALKFLKSAFFEKEEEVKFDCISFACILMLAIATSIDAMGAGISFRFTNVPLLLPSIVIGIVTFINSLIGFWTACLCKKFPSKYVEVLGACLLIYLAIKAVI